MLAEEIDARNAQRWSAVPDYIHHLVTHYPVKAPRAVCLDIESTILHESTHVIIPNCLTALEYLKAHDIVVFFITARSSRLRVDTINELRDQGVHDTLYESLLINEDDEDDHGELKARHREHIRQKFSLVMAIGDRVHDLIQHDESDVAYYNLLMESLRQH